MGRILEARVGIEPTHKGFADLSLTTWVPRLTGLGLRSRPAEIRKSVSQGMVNRKHIPFGDDRQQPMDDNNTIPGAGDRGRTGDIFLGKEALYH